MRMYKSYNNIISTVGYCHAYLALYADTSHYCSLLPLPLPLPSLHMLYRLAYSS
jgi:hypothetical protein